MSSLRHPVAPARHGLTGMATGLAIGGSVGAGAFVWWGSTHAEVALVIVMGAIALFPVVLRVVQGRWDAFEPIQLFALCIAVLFCARPAFEIADNVTTYGQYYARSGFIAALWVCIGGTISLYAGYFLPLGAWLARRLRPLPNQWDRNRSVRFVSWTLVLGVFLTLGYVSAIGGFSAWIQSLRGRSGAASFILLQQGNAYFAQGPYLTIPTSFILLAAWQRRRSLLVGVLLCLTVGVALALTVPGGDRTFILQLLLPLIMMWFLRRRRRPHALGIAVVVLISIIGANVLVSVRDVRTRAQHPLLPTVEHAIAHPVGEIKAFMLGADPSEFTVLEIEVHKLNTPSSVHFHPGATIASILVGPVPRQLIGTKPMSGLEHITYDLFPVTRAQRASFGPSWLGDLYDDSGWVSVIGFCLLIGAAVRAIWEYFRANQDSLGMQIVFAAMMPMYIVLVRNSLTDVIARSIFMTFPVIVCTLICSRPRTPRPTGEGRGSADFAST